MRIAFLKALGLDILFFAFLLELLVVHLYVGSGTQVWELTVEGRITTFQQVDLRVDQQRVLVNVQVPVDLSDCFIKEGSSLLRELAVNNDWHLIGHPLFNLRFVSEERGPDLFRVCEVLCALDVASFKFIVKAGIEDDNFLILLHQRGQR